MIRLNRFKYVAHDYKDLMVKLELHRMFKPGIRHYDQGSAEKHNENLDRIEIDGIQTGIGHGQCSSADLWLR